MSENSCPQDGVDTVVEAATTRHKRTLELEELRKKQLAKSRQEAMVDNGKGRAVLSYMKAFQLS